MDVPSRQTAMPSVAGSFLPMRHTLHAQSSIDDWSGLKDAKERRKRQNRLNVRAHRQRKAAGTQCQQAHTKHYCLDDPVHIDARQYPVFQAVTQAQRAPMPWLFASCAPIRQWDSLDIMRLLCPLPVDQRLLTLIRYNIARAIATNMSLLGIMQITVSGECTLMRGNLELFPPPECMPESLTPTVLQRTTPHGTWIDLLPHPCLRDNLIRLAGAYNECEFMGDCAGGVHEDGSLSVTEDAGMLVWTEPWHSRGWELTEVFVKKWAMLLEGCQDIIEASNYWRSLRGQEPMNVTL